MLKENSKTISQAPSDKQQSYPIENNINFLKIKLNKMALLKQLKFLNIEGTHINNFKLNAIQ
jgi:hypothetical protein